MYRFALLALLIVSPTARADGIDKEKLARIDAAVEAAVKRTAAPGRSWSSSTPMPWSSARRTATGPCSPPRCR